MDLQLYIEAKDAREAAIRLLKEFCQAPDISKLTLNEVTRFLEDDKADTFLAFVQRTAFVLLLCAFHPIPKAIPEGGWDKKLEESRNEFLSRYQITGKDLEFITAILKGVPLHKFPQELGISRSRGNVRIRNLWERLGLKNREQLIFVAGWMRLVTPDYGCLKSAGERNTFDPERDT